MSLIEASEQDEAEEALVDFVLMALIVSPPEKVVALCCNGVLNGPRFKWAAGTKVALLSNRPNRAGKPAHITKPEAELFASLKKRSPKKEKQVWRWGKDVSQNKEITKRKQELLESASSTETELLESASSE